MPIEAPFRLISAQTAQENAVPWRGRQFATRRGTKFLRAGRASASGDFAL